MMEACRCGGRHDCAYPIQIPWVLLCSAGKHKQLYHLTLFVAMPVCRVGVQVWDMDIGDCILQLRPPQAPTALSPMGVPAAAAAPQPLTCLAVTPDGSCCLCGDVDGWLTGWHLGSGVLVQRIRAHNGRWVLTFLQFPHFSAVTCTPKSPQKCRWVWAILCQCSSRLSGTGMASS